jgi:bifunctional DNA primase/polymerase-like protein
VFPLPPGSKEAAADWHRRCTTDPAAAAGWPAGSNTGVGCRASSIVALDLDRHAGKPDGGAGNNRAVSTVTASSFLNAAGRLGGWSAWPERVVGIARPLAGLAALVSLGLPRVPGPLQLRG